MYSVVKMGLSLALGLCVARAAAQEPVWRPARASKPAPTITLGRPVPLDGPPVVAAAYVAPPSPAPSINLGTPLPFARGQGAELQPPTPPPPAPSPFVAGGPGAEEAYNCGVAGAKTGGFFSRAWDGCRDWFHGVPGSVQGIFQPGPGGRGIFESDHRYDDKLISPTTNPFYFEDPRALTEVRPIFMWQRTPASNYIFAGGDNFFAGLQGRLAITPWFSVVVHQLGWTWLEAENQIGEFQDNHAGFSEFHIGPKVTFLHLDNFVMAAGLIFEVPVGSSKVFQDTGSLGLAPYFSLGWNVCSGTYGSLIFLNTTGYSAGVNNERGQFVWSSFNLSYDVVNLHRFYPFIEFNFKHYTVNGQTRDIGFEGSDMFHFGSRGAAGHDELTMALGTRVKLNDCIQFGIGGELSLIGGGRHMDRFRLTTDMIFRY